MTPSPPPLHPPNSLTPLWAANLFTFINSLGTGLVTNGIFYLTQSEQGYQFTAVENLWLGVAIGITYIAGAKAAGPLQRRLRRLFPRLTSRGFLLLIMAAMSLLCAIPPALASFGVQPRSTLGILGLATLTLAYSPLSGMLWPTVESYVAGGRRGAQLRSAIGVWNVVWSSAIPLAYWGMSGLIERSPIAAFVGLSIVHLAAAALLTRFRAEPAPHAHEEHEPHPPIYQRLLRVLRLMLPLAYVMTSALGPILPELLKGLGIRETWRPIIGSAWLVPRVLTFYLMQRWHGWHGTRGWLTPIVAGAMLLFGFAGAVLFPLLGVSPVTIPLVIASLTIFGTGMAVLYAAAIYYALEVGNSGVDAGGTHEALIGVGYTLGPICGLGGAGLVHAGLLVSRYEQAAVLGFVSVLVLVVAAMLVRSAK